MANVLVAASAEISHRAWMMRCLEPLFRRSDIEVVQFGDNSTLSSLLQELNCVKENVARGAAAERRSEIRRALSKSDYLLMMWDGRSLTKLLFEARLASKSMKLYTIELATVVNKDRGDGFDVYVGRGTPWGNPYPVGKQEGQYERNESIRLFRRHFEENIISNPELKSWLLSFRGLRLACHCKPLAGHGDVIASYLNSLDPDEVERVVGLNLKEDEE